MKFRPMIQKIFGQHLCTMQFADEHAHPDKIAKMLTHLNVIKIFIKI